MTAQEKQAARREIVDRLERTRLGSPEWLVEMLRLGEFDREHPELWTDDEDSH